MMRRLVWIVAISLVAAACGGEAVAAPEPSPEEFEITPQRRLPHPAPPLSEPRPRFPGFERVHQGVVALAAMAKGELPVFESPDHPDPFLTLPAETIIGSTTVVALVGAPVDGWAEVRVPVRPNGSTGWIRIDEVDLFVVSGRIVVDLSDRSLSFYQDGVEVLTAQVAVGSSRSPTPTGVFYVTDSVTLTKAGTPWGPHALGLSARSDHITEFNGGDGIIGIHGTSRPSSIGEAASMGCIRLHNEMITRLHALVPLGTPVEIRA